MKKLVLTIVLTLCLSATAFADKILILDLTDFGAISDDLIPSIDGTYDVGSSTKEWQDGWFDGTLNADAFTCVDCIGTAHMADADHGDFSYSGGSATLDADVVGAAELADADYGDITITGGVMSLDADVVAAAEMADADHGDVAWSGGVADVEASTSGGIVFDSTADAAGDFGYASNVFYFFGGNSEEIGFVVGASSNAASLTTTSGITSFDFPMDLTADSFTADAADDPAHYYDPSTASESEWWVGVNHDSVGDDNDAYEIRQSATPGTSVAISVAASSFRTTFSGAVAYSTATLSGAGPTDNLNVANVNVVFIDTSSNGVTLGGMTGGVSGQVLHLVATSTSNNYTVEHNESTGNQDIFLADEADQVVTTYGGHTLVCNGSHWYEVGY